MTASGENFGSQVERKVAALVSALKKSQAENLELQEEIKKLNNEIRKAHAELVGLQKKYDNLQLAQAGIHLAKGDVKTAKRRMTEIIQQIDICIAKLSE